MKKTKVLVIVGPTASGKSALAVELAQKFNGEIISADSRQVYRGLDIGTGKITKREMKGIPHHLLDVVSPKKKFTAHDFCKKASPILKSVAHKGKLAILCGGTGFYIDALLGRISLPAVEPDPALRKGLAKKSAAALYALLQKKDPKRALSMSSPSERNNKVRLVRALEIARSKHTKAGPSYTEARPLYDALWIGIMSPFDVLEKKIRHRLKARIQRGMIAEARRLHAKGLSYNRMEELGLEYRSLARLLRNKITKTEFEKELYRDIRRYAKKQISYWKRNTEIHWFTFQATKRIDSYVEEWLSDYLKRIPNTISAVSLMK